MFPPAVIAGLLLAGAGFFESMTVFLGTRFSVKNIPRELNFINMKKERNAGI